MALIAIIGASLYGGFVYGATELVCYIADRRFDEQSKRFNLTLKEKDETKKKELILQYEKDYKLKYSPYHMFGENYKEYEALILGKEISIVDIRNKLKLKIIF